MPSVNIFRSIGYNPPLTPTSMAFTPSSSTDSVYGNFNIECGTFSVADLFPFDFSFGSFITGLEFTEPMLDLGVFGSSANFELNFNVGSFDDTSFFSNFILSFGNF